MERKYVKCWCDWRQKMTALTYEEKGRLLDAILEYRDTGNIIDMPGNEKILFPVFQIEVDRDREAYDTKVLNGKKGGAPITKNNQTEPNRTERNRTEPNITETAQYKEKEKDIREKKKNYIPPISPQGFDEFWSSYPKKVGKQAALKSWSRLSPDDELTQRILSAVEYQRSTAQWQSENGRYIPNPATWLNQGRWEDEGYVPSAPMSFAAIARQMDEEGL